MIDAIGGSISLTFMILINSEIALFRLSQAMQIRLELPIFLMVDLKQDQQ